MQFIFSFPYAVRVSLEPFLSVGPMSHPVDPLRLLKHSDLHLLGPGVIAFISGFPGQAGE